MQHHEGHDVTGSGDMGSVGNTPKGGTAGRKLRTLAKSAARLRDGVTRFTTARDGNVAMISAVVTVPIVMVMAVALDTAELYRAKENFQQSADAAVLIAAKIYVDGGDNAKQRARQAGVRAFRDNLANLPRSKGFPKFTFPETCEDGNITVKATGTHPLFFPAVHGVSSGEDAGAELSVSAAVACPTTSFEVALVVDTSGSMRCLPGETPGCQWNERAGSKIAVLKDAATGLAEDMFASAAGPAGKVKFGVVPFSGMVAVDHENDTVDGTNSTQSWSRASYEDTQGRSPIHHKDLDWSWDTARGAKQVTEGGITVWKDADDKYLTRDTLFADLNVKWKGCLQARPYPHAVLDTPPTASDPATLFVPAFAPDEPDRYNGEDQWVDGYEYAYCVRFAWWYDRSGNRYRLCGEWSDGEEWYTNNNGNPRTPSPNDGTYYVDEVYQIANIKKEGTVSGEKLFRNDYIDDGRNMPLDNKCRGKITHADCSGTRDQMLRQAFTFKYKTPAGQADFKEPYPTESYENPRGPNFSCWVKPMMPLSDSESTVKAKINSLSGVGATNVPAGAAWGWRVLSSNPPFVGEKESKLDNRKIMVLMTDGLNTYYNARERLTGSDLTNYGHLENKSTYSGYGYARHHDGVNSTTKGDGFLFDGFSQNAPKHDPTTWSEAMDERLLQTCRGAKGDNITIYTIAFDVAEGAPIKEKLLECASPTEASGEGVADASGQRKLYYDAANAQDLRDAFKEIAESVKRLKMVQ